MKPMIRAVLVFLVGCLVLAIVLYVANLIIAMLTLPAAIAQIAMILVGLIGLLCLIYLCVNVFNSTPPGGPL
jgi:uncharacterized membrane protein YuzA (DUF378 family)